MKEFPFVSVIVAAYNSERSIGRCIESLLAMDYPDFGIIIVDNNSNDGTAAIVKQYHITYLFEEKKGWPAARNTGISRSQAKYVANIDADCFATKDWLKHLVNAIEKDSRTGCVVGKTLIEEGETLAQKYYASKEPFVIEHKIGKTDFVPWGGGNNIMLREAFIKAGRYASDKFRSGAGVEFHNRMEKTLGYKTEYEPNALIYHEARGSIKEFFGVATKYAHDGYLRSREKEMKELKQKYHFFLFRKIVLLAGLTAGIAYRSVKTLIGKDTWFRVVSNYFSIISASGTIYGYCKARIKSIQNN